MVIHFLTAKGRKVAEIHRELVQTYGENCIGVPNVGRWWSDFENNRCVSLEDEWCSSWLVDSLIVDNIRRVCEILETDDCFTLDEIVVCILPLRCGW